MYYFLPHTIPCIIAATCGRTLAYWQHQRFPVQNITDKIRAMSQLREWPTALRWCAEPKIRTRTSLYFGTIHECTCAHEHILALFWKTCKIYDIRYVLLWRLHHKHERKLENLADDLYQSCTTKTGVSERPSTSPNQFVSCFKITMVTNWDTSRTRNESLDRCICSVFHVCSDEMARARLSPFPAEKHPIFRSSLRCWRTIFGVSHI